MKRALKEDPTVYQYDEVYDDIERSKVEEKISKKTVEKKAKYIDKLLKAADRRKREQEHRVERMVQKEREAEGAMFADKESFVTSAYRAKLEEFKKMEEEEKRMDRLEAIGDVTKQQDISGFYRHLYHQTVDPDKKQGEKEEVKKEDESMDKSANSDKAEKQDEENVDVDDPLTSDSENSSDNEEERDSERAREARQTLTRGANKRQYRKRVAEDSQYSSESELENEKSTSKSLKSEEVDQDKEDKVPEKRAKLSLDDREEKEQNIQTKTKRDSSNDKSERNLPESKEASEKLVEEKQKKEESVKKVKKIEPETPKVSIWEKRTVGPAFEAALERYYARKAARSSG